MNAIDPRFAPVIDRVRSDEQTKHEEREAARAAKLQQEAEARAKRAEERRAKARNTFEDYFISEVIGLQSTNRWSADEFVSATAYASALISPDDTVVPEIDDKMAEALQRAFAFNVVKTPHFQETEYYVGQRLPWYEEWHGHAVAWHKRQRANAERRQPTTETRFSTSTGDTPEDVAAKQGAEQPDVSEGLTQSLANDPRLVQFVTPAEAITPKKRGGSRRTGHSKGKKLTSVS